MQRNPTDRPFFLEWTALAHQMVAAVLQPGDVAVDATVGNGHDTLFLAQRVGPQGHVYGFDVQEEALERTRQRLEAAALQDRVTLLQMGHERMDEAIPPTWHGHIGAVMFNLGYLPEGRDRTCITTPETTLPALQMALRLLRPGGVLTVVAYQRHPGGAEETDAVRSWAAALPATRYLVASCALANLPRTAPVLLGIYKKR